MTQIHDFFNLKPDTILDAIESTGRLCDGRVLALNSYENRVYRIGIEDDTPIIAKFYRPERWSIEQILEDHTFSQELSDHELPVVPPIQDSDGQTIFQHKSFLFSLYPLRGGRAPELDNPDQLEQMGRFIARIHLIGEQKDFIHRPNISIDRLGTEQVDFLLNSEHMPREIHASFNAITTDLLAVIKDRFSLAKNVKTLRLHADMHSGNILWHEQIPHIVDLDDCAQGPAIQDLWMFLSGSRDYQMARLGDLLIGYEQFREFDSNELLLVEPLRALRQINYAGWIARRWHDPAFKLAFPWFGEPRYWDELILGLREQRAAFDEPPLQW